MNAAPQSAKVARANGALRDLRRADQSREGASPSWHIPYTVWCWRNPRNSKWPISKTGSATSTAKDDVALIGPTGDAVIAGTAAPGAAVELLRNGESYDRAIADQFGRLTNWRGGSVAPTYRRALTPIEPRGRAYLFRGIAGLIYSRGMAACWLRAIPSCGWLRSFARVFSPSTSSRSKGATRRPASGATLVPD